MKHYAKEVVERPGIYDTLMLPCVDGDMRVQIRTWDNPRSQVYVKTIRCRAVPDPGFFAFKPKHKPMRRMSKVIFDDAEVMAALFQLPASVKRDSGYRFTINVVDAPACGRGRSVPHYDLALYTPEGQVLYARVQKASPFARNMLAFVRHLDSVGIPGTFSKESRIEQAQAPRRRRYGR